MAPSPCRAVHFTPQPETSGLVVTAWYHFNPSMSASVHRTVAKACKGTVNWTPLRPRAAVELKPSVIQGSVKHASFQNVSFNVTFNSPRHPTRQNCFRLFFFKFDSLGSLFTVCAVRYVFELGDLCVRLECTSGASRANMFLVMTKYIANDVKNDNFWPCLHFSGRKPDKNFYLLKRKFAYLHFYCMEQSPSWEVNRLSASQEIPRV